MLVRAIVAGLLALAAAPVAAQEYPSRPIKVVVGQVAGGGADIITRYFTDALSKLAGQPVIVENKPGAGGNLATQAVASAEADGYTLLFSTSNPLTGNFYLYKNLPFTLADFAPVTTLGQGAFVLSVDGKSPVKSVADLTALLKEKGSKAAYGTGTSIAFACSEIYLAHEGLTARIVRYRATTQALTDLKAGDIDFFFIDSTGALAPAKRGDIRLLAVTTKSRIAALPDIPTMQEAAGIPDFDMPSWFGIFTPAKTPKAIRDKLESWLNEIVRRPQTRDYLTGIGIDALPGSPELLMSIVHRQTETYRKLSEAGKLSAE